MHSLTSKKINAKMLWPIILIALGVLGYFLYQGFFSPEEVVLDSASNAYLTNTKIGKYVDILNKENLTFDTNINKNILENSEDFSVQIFPSEGVGRSNPFLP